MTGLLLVALFVALRIYRGRDYNKGSRPLTWAFGAFLGAYPFLDGGWPQVVLGGAVGALATWCIVWSYKNAGGDWHDYKSMAVRSTPAAFIPVVCIAAELFFGVPFEPFQVIFIPIKLFFDTLV